VAKESFCCNYVRATAVVYIHEDRQITSGQLDKRSGVSCDEPTSHQGRGGGNTPSRFVPQKPEKTADTNESAGPGSVQFPGLNGLHVCTVLACVAVFSVSFQASRSRARARGQR